MVPGCFAVFALARGDFTGITSVGRLAAGTHFDGDGYEDLAIATLFL